MLEITWSECVLMIYLCCDLKESRRGQERNNHIGRQALQHDHDRHDRAAAAPRHQDGHHQNGQHHHKQGGHREAAHHVALRGGEAKDIGGADGQSGHTAGQCRVLPAQSLFHKRDKGTFGAVAF